MNALPDVLQPYAAEIERLICANQRADFMALAEQHICYIHAVCLYRTLRVTLAGEKLLAAHMHVYGCRADQRYGWK